MTSKVYTEKNGDERVGYRAVSRWLQIDYTVVSPKHRLAMYADKTEDRRLPLTYFRHNSKWYALNQFLRLYQPIVLENGSKLVGYDTEGGIKPLVIEISNDGETVRLWETVEIKED